MGFNNLAAFIHDDITWCMEDDCPVTCCRRNVCNMMDRTGIHSFAMFKGTDECIIGGCMEYCAHAKKCFSENKNPDDAISELQKHCDRCMFASMEED